MRSRIRLFRAAWLPFIGAAIPLVWSIVAISDDGRTRIGAEVLARSRGSNQNYVLNFSSCNAYNMNLPCYEGTIGSCVTCANANFLTLKVGSGGGYMAKAGTQPCGNNLLGTCNGVDTECMNPGQVVGICRTFPSNVGVQ